MFALSAIRRCSGPKSALHKAIASCWQAQLQQAAHGSGISNSSETLSCSSTACEPETPLLQTIRQRIMIRGGPLSVADYMQEVLTNPTSGYYMKRDVFGSSGDFTTSPEISQMFGEMLGIWCVVVWQSLGMPKQFNLVELGPGRGTLMADLLRGTAGFTPFADALQVHLVEVSPFMRQQQWTKLQCSSSSSSSSGSSRSSTDAAQQQQKQELSSGICGLNASQVHWHLSLDAVPNTGPSIYIAHEFLDALPVHQFVKDPRRGWLEVMVDTVEDDPANENNPSSSSSSSSSSHLGIPLVQQQQQNRVLPGQLQQQQQGCNAADQQQQQQQQQQGLHLRYVLSPGPTPASQLLVPRRLEALQQQDGSAEQKQLDAIEIGAHAMAVCETLARRIGAAGGAALLIDYGQNKPYTNSLTAIKSHQGVHPLSQPGTADLSAWVDFSAMRTAAEQALDVEQAAAAGGKLGTAARAVGDDVGAAAAPAAAAASGGVDVHGPVSQAHLLHSLGIQARLEALAQSATPKQVESLISGYQRLVDQGPGGMGAAYLAMAITQKGMPAPVGFAEQ